MKVIDIKTKSQTATAECASETTTETETPAPEALAPQEQLTRFIELRSQGWSLGNISERLGVPKTTLFGWNVRHRETIERLKRVEMEALEERILGTHQEQFAILSSMLKCLESNFAHQLKEYEEDLSMTELFWMAANLRRQVERLRSAQPLTDAPLEQNRTNPNELPPPSNACS